MADVTVRRTEDFEATFRGGMLRARAGLGLTSFGMQIIRFPPHADRYPEHDHAEDGQEEVYTVLEGEATLRAGGEEHTLEPGVFARVGPERDAGSWSRASRAPSCSRSAGSPGGRSRSPSTPRRASRTRSPELPEREMADVTVKRIEEFEAIFGGGFRRARAGLGVSSFGLAVMELPPNFGDYPDHDQAHDHQEEVYTVLSGRATIRVGGEGGEEHELAPGSGSASGRRSGARSSPATSPPGCSRSAARPARPTRRPSSPRRARPTRSASSTPHPL